MDKSTEQTRNTKHENISVLDSRSKSDVCLGGLSQLSQLSLICSRTRSYHRRTCNLVYLNCSQIPNEMVGLSRDSWLLFCASLVRLFAQGCLSVTLFLYLSTIGLSLVSVGKLLSAILVGDLLLSIYLTTNADAVGRQLVSMMGALLQFFAGVALATTDDLRVLVTAGVVGIVSATGADSGPYQAVEQAAIAQCLNSDNTNTSQIFGYYTAASYAMQGAVTITSGYLMHSLQSRYQWTNVEI